MSLVDAAVVPVALLWALHTSGCDSKLNMPERVDLSMRKQRRYSRYALYLIAHTCQV
jgi:hypothetical protein